ncbi:type II secretion system F family protein [Mycolicibacterium pulveris]|uniref:Type II secretion system protein F n=1 Tax=Mycolicibacterium pulveris TaxID=36813 RepID=A0A7I7UJQ5_MYCPV|nr:type II secretion system F family protein [Mycolicibacterium pulveris]MCV6980211.1 type II secretion system F family protein [Mycolicibacterium pulveris]BBY81595.1 type II secretion system protein F [Mycolicibacterium pulveris]
MTAAALLLAAAILVGPGACRALPAVNASKPAVAQPNQDGPDPLAVASALDVFAACLRSGMAVSPAAAASAPLAPPALGGLLTRAAHLLALGADPALAWSAPGGHGNRHLEALLRLTRRSAVSGAALADGVTDLATRTRDDAAAAARAAAERASVLIAGPLGLCYLPAFLCLGIVPVVAGLAGDVLRSGVV